LWLLQTRGVVVDEAGRPLSKAFSDYIRPEPFRETGADGTFELRSPISVFLVRRIGFHSAVARPPASGELRVVLRALPREGQFPICRGAHALKKVTSPELRLPQKDGLLRKAVVSIGDDFWNKTYHVKGVKTRIVQGGGAMWGISTMRNEDAAAATVVEDATYWGDRGFGRFPVHVSRWTTADGRHHRMIGILGGGFSYRGALSKELPVLDALMDDVCLQLP
jgi:hypothetical protein